jgi:F0F1-type ATP synthase assembly protein I
VKDRSDGDEREKAASGGFGRRGAKAYQAALEAVFSIPIAAGLGYWADRHLGTDPILLLVGMALGFTTFVVRIVRMRGLMASPGDDDESERDGR